MAGARIHFTLDDAAFNRGVQQLGGVLSHGVLRAIGTGLVMETQHRFDAGSDPFGQRWAALNPAYAAIKRGPRTLVESGMSGGLLGSITMDVAGSRITVGSNKIYAAVHQFGATIKPVRAKALVFRLGRGKGGVVRAKSVTIPARPYLGFGPADQRVVMETVATFIGRALG